jgi:hypothetical protein
MKRRGLFSGEARSAPEEAAPPKPDVFRQARARLQEYWSPATRAQEPSELAEDLRKLGLSVLQLRILAGSVPLGSGTYRDRMDEIRMVLAGLAAEGS